MDIANAARIFTTARHPKSFVSLDRADHLLGARADVLGARADAAYAANVIAAWDVLEGKHIGFQPGKKGASESEGRLELTDF